MTQIRQGLKKDHELMPCFLLDSWTLRGHSQLRGPLSQCHQELSVGAAQGAAATVREAQQTGEAQQIVHGH